jgi:hypothetical protein
LGAYDWRIKVDPGPSEDYGETDYDKAEITIWPANHQSPERLVGTVIHELLHVIHDDKAPTGDAEEETVVVAFEHRPCLAIPRQPKATQLDQARTEEVTMIVGVLANHILDAFGVVWIVSVAVKISRGYPIKRWFF